MSKIKILISISIFSFLLIGTSILKNKTRIIEKILFLLSKQNDAEIQSLASLENFLLFIVEKKHGINKKQPIEQFTLLLNEVRDKSNWLKIYKFDLQ